MRFPDKDVWWNSLRQAPKIAGQSSHPWLSSQTAAQDGRLRWPPKIAVPEVCPRSLLKKDSQDGCPEKPPKMAVWDGYLGRVPKKATQDGCPRWTSEVAAPDGRPRWLIKKVPQVTNKAAPQTTPEASLPCKLSPRQVCPAKYQVQNIACTVYSSK